ncbi:MAG: 50S ribosomal protein L6 [archaeon]
MKKEESIIIEIPEGIEFSVEGSRVKFSNGKEETEREFKAREIRFEKKDGNLILNTKKYSRKTKSVMNAVRSHVMNLITGLKNGFEYKLMVVYSHFPINLAVKEGFLEINNFAGEKNPRKATIVGKSTVEVKGKEVYVRGRIKEEVGQTAANIETSTKVKGKDRRVFQDGIYRVSKMVKE